MSAGDFAAVLVTFAVVVAVAVMAVVLSQLVATLRELRTAVRQLRDEAVPAVRELRSTLRQTNAELDRVDDILDKAEAVGRAVDGASDATYRAVSRPIIKAASVGSGVGEGWRGFRRRRRRGELPSRTGPDS